MRRAGVVTTVVVLAVAAGCSAGSEDDGPKVLQPGRPGEPAQTLDGDPTVDEAGWNDADVAFVQMMIRHHAQALRMCELAKTRAQDERVRAIAGRIAGAQGPEIVGMSAWLQGHGLDVPSAADLRSGHHHGAHHHGAHHHGAHHHGALRMPGMLTAAEMRRLEAAEGARFDRLFLTGMVGHHHGAVVMAREALDEGTDLRVQEIATDAAVEQSAEIGRMRDVLRGS